MSDRDVSTEHVVSSISFLPTGCNFFSSFKGHANLLSIVSKYHSSGFFFKILQKYVVYFVFVFIFVREAKIRYSLCII